jgi:hypothetical protein
MHGVRIIAFDQVGSPAAAAEELLQLIPLNAREDGRVRDLDSR